MPVAQPSSPATPKTRHGTQPMLLCTQPITKNTGTFILGYGQGPECEEPAKPWTERSCASRAPQSLEEKHVQTLHLLACAGYERMLLALRAEPLTTTCLEGPRACV